LKPLNSARLGRYVTADGGFTAQCTPERPAMGRRDLPANVAGRKTLPVDAAPETAEMPGAGRLWPVWVVLVACTWIALSPALSNGFVDFDDPGWILENLSFRGLGWEQIRFAFTTSTGGVYQPLGWLMQSLTYVLFGLDPRGFHLVSLFFHVVNVVLLHLLCVRLVARSMPEVAGRLGRARGWLCAVPVAFYAVHPLRVELVAWASVQAYLPGMSVSLLATLAYLQAHPASGGLRRPWLIGSFVLTAVAVLTKASAVVLPFIFLILDAYPLGRFGPGHPSWPAVRKAVIEKGPILLFCFALMTVAFVVKPLWLEPEENAIQPQPVLVGRVAQACFGAWFYLAKTVWPFELTIFYPRPEGDEYRTPLFAACFAGVVLAAAAAFRLRRRWPWFPATLAAYLMIASPFLGLARVSVTLVSDRYCHSSVMAWSILGCAGICRLAQRRWPGPVRLGAGAGTLVVVVGLMELSIAQCHVWESNEHLWSHALKYAGWSAKLHDYMGATFAEEGKFDRAIAEFREALRIRPHYFEALRDLGAALDARGDADPAITYLREAAKLRPKDAKVHLNLGAALVHERHVDEAVGVYREGLQFQPDFPNLHFNLGVALIYQHKVDEAIRELTRAVELRPWYTEVYAALGGAYVLQGRQADAVVQYRKALGLEPDHSASRIGLGLALARQGRSAEAINELREAIRRDRGNPEAHHVLAAILASSGRIEEAAAEYEEVLRLRPDHAQARVFLAKARALRKG
jgi:Flp pilus assembly protein TadD